MTIISSGHKNEIQFFRNHLPCPWILKKIRRKKLFNPPDIVILSVLATCAYEYIIRSLASATALFKIVYRTFDLSAVSISTAVFYQFR